MLTELTTWIIDHQSKIVKNFKTCSVLISHWFYWKLILDLAWTVKAAVLAHSDDTGVVYGIVYMPDNLAAPNVKEGEELIVPAPLLQHINSLPYLIQVMAATISPPEADVLI